MAAKRNNTDTKPSVVPQRAERAIRSIEQLPEEKLNEIESAVPDNWVTDDSGQAFPPYWKPAVGAFFRGIPLYRDERDADFNRWHIEATLAHECFRGDKDSKEIVPVGTGEIFTISGCKGLLLERYVGVEIVAIVTSVDTLPGNEESEWQPRDFYRFSVRVSPENAKLLKDMRSTVRTQLIAMAKKKALDNMLQIAAGQMVSNSVPRARQTANAD